MLGRTAGELYWMFRQLERSENTARLIEAGMRIALTRSAWKAVANDTGAHLITVELMCSDQDAHRRRWSWTRTFSSAVSSSSIRPIIVGYVLT